MNRSIVIKGVLALSLVLFLFLSEYVWDIVSLFHPDRIQEILVKAGSLAPFFYMIIMALAVVVSPIPSVPLDVAAGVFFGPFLGTIYSAIGALGGAVASFLIARFLGREMIERFLGGHINFCTKCSNRLLTKVIFLSRLLPFVSRYFGRSFVTKDSLPTVANLSFAIGFFSLFTSLRCST